MPSANSSSKQRRHGAEHTHSLTSLPSLALLLPCLWGIRVRRNFSELISSQCRAPSLSPHPPPRSLLPLFAGAVSSARVRLLPRVRQPRRLSPLPVLPLLLSPFIARRRRRFPDWGASFRERRVGSLLLLLLMPWSLAAGVARRPPPLFSWSQPSCSLTYVPLFFPFAFFCLPFAALFLYFG